MSEYVVRRPARSDSEALAAFARGIWPKRDPHVLDRRWWWNGPGAPQAWIVEHLPSRSVVAMCGARETEISVGGRRLAAASIGDWYVAAGHAGKGLGRLLVAESAATHPVMYTTTISEAAAVAFKRMGWRADEALPIFAGATPLAALAGRAGLELREGLDDDLDLDGLWSGAGMVAVPRDSAHLRAHLALVPHRRYQLLRAYRGSRLTGYLLWRILPRRSFRRLPQLRIGLLADHFASDGAAFKALVGGVARRLVAARVGVLLALATRPDDTRVLSRLGFASPRLPFLSRLSSRGMYLAGEDLGRLVGDWHITFADNDMDFSFGSAIEEELSVEDGHRQPADP